jgi:hypothetical protein
METIVANAGTTPYPIPRAKTAKLDSVEFGSDEFQYMLATFCFDAQRKLLYFCKAALPILDRVDPKFREAVRKDTDDINNEPNWERRARKTEEIMLRLQREVGGKLEQGEPALKR